MKDFTSKFLKIDCGSYYVVMWLDVAIGDASIFGFHRMDKEAKVATHFWWTFNQAWHRFGKMF